MKKTTILIFSLLMINLVSFGQFDNGTNLKIKAGFGAGVPIGPVESKELSGLTNYYNNFPFYTGINLEIYPGLVEGIIIGGIYYSSLSYSAWDSPDQSVLYTGSSGFMKNFGISLLFDIPNLGKNMDSKISIVPNLKLGISNFNNTVKGISYLNYEPYREVYYDTHKTLHLSFSTNFETTMTPKISFYAQPGLDIYPMLGEFNSQKALYLLSVKAGFNFYLFRNKTIY